MSMRKKIRAQNLLPSGSVLLQRHGRFLPDPSAHGPLSESYLLDRQKSNGLMGAGRFMNTLKISVRSSESFREQAGRASVRDRLRGTVCLALGLFFVALNLQAQEAYRAPGTPKPSASPRATGSSTTSSATRTTTAPKPRASASPTKVSQLKKLSIEQLVDTEITSAARRPEKLSEVSSAVSVITADDIEHAGVTNIPDALRLGTEMEVAQIDGHTWAISARGFNVSASNKMQVLMDGRSLYTPLFSGVFWDVQKTFLPDIAQIEIIRGPGATLWGANAINGVINIRTRTADETQGFLMYGGGGYENDGFGGLRYGGKIGADTSYRVYAMTENGDGLPLQGDGMEDGSIITQGGFRVDSHILSPDLLTLQGDFYGGNFEQLNGDDGEVNGQNVLARWTHEFAPDSSLMVQAYWDRTHRLIPDLFREDRNTFDVEFQHQLRWDEHYIVYGANYRLSHDNIGNLGPTLAFLPHDDTQHLVSGYVQDEWHLFPDKFYITAGSKFEYNTFSGFEVQPTGRLTWQPAENQTVWGAVSRAVRTPTRIDQDLFAPNPKFGPPFLVGNPGFESETLISYELGYRIRPTNTVAFDLAAYYNDYDNLRSVETLPNGKIRIENKLVGDTYGASLAVKWLVLNWWQLDGSVSGINVNIHQAPGGHDIGHAEGETNDPNWMFMFHSGMELPWNLRLDSYLRFVDNLPHPDTPYYLTADVRLAWSPRKNCEIAIVGRNLFDDTHPEFASTPTREVERTVYAMFKWSF